MQPVLSAVALLALTLWVGGMFGVLLSTPLLFKHLQSREQAGAIAGRIIDRTQSLGGPLGILALIATVLRFSTGVQAGMAAGVRTATAVVVGFMVALSLANSMLVQQKLSEIKAAIGGPIDGLARDHPLRVRYNRVHGLSMLLFVVVFALGLVAIVLTAVG